MPNVPLSTRFVGFAQQTNLQERKSANINALSQPFTMQDIANTVGGASTPSFTYSVIGGTIPKIQISYGIGSGTVRDGVSGQNTIQTYYAPVITRISNCTASSLTFFTEILGALEWDFSNQSQYAPIIPIINFPNLTTIVSTPLSSSQINIKNVPEITILSVPLLTNGYIYFYICESLTTLNISSLTNSGGNISVYGCDSLSFSGISFNTQFSNFEFSYCEGLGATINIPATDIYTNINNCTNITDLSFPNAVNYPNGGYFRGESNLENVSLGSVGTVKTATANFDFVDCALSSASVTHILDILISLDGTNGTTEWVDVLDISGGTNAAPSESDIVKIDILQARGARVIYN